jgi:hypothetical protein
MLKSIKQSLNTNGKLILLEPLKNQTNAEKCAFRLDESKLKSYLKKGGFVLIRQFNTEFSVFLEYSIDNN